MQLLTIGDLDNLEANLPLVEMFKGLSGDYDRFLDNYEEKGNRAPGIHASEISGCERKAVYSILGEQRVKNIPARWRKRFDVGHAVHDMLQTHFERMARASGGRFSFEREVRISPKLQPVAAMWEIVSSCDGVFTFYDESGNPIARCVLEIKTSSPGEFEKLKGPQPDHIEQAHVYMACLDIPYTWFLYTNKGNQNITGSNNPAFLIPFDYAVWAKLEEKFARMLEAAATQTLPDRLESIVCEFCSYRELCQPGFLKKRTMKVDHGRWAKR